MLTFRLARADEYAPYARVFFDCFHGSLVGDEQYFNDIITSGNKFLYFAILDNEVVGMVYCFLWEHPELGTTAEIQNLSVLKVHRQKGIASQLINYLLKNVHRSCKWFEIIDASGGITGKIVSKAGFKPLNDSRLTYRLSSYSVLGDTGVV